ncbi:MAG: hypothetical protein N2D54_02470, partial [Chloroflexota bacterium]
PEGTINLITDQKEFFEDMENLIYANGRYFKTHPERYLTDTGYAQKTRFQEAWERKGRPTFRLKLKLSP